MTGWGRRLRRRTSCACRGPHPPPPHPWALAGRGAAQVLEKFLDDDEDMHDLNLTANHIADHPDEQHHAAATGGGPGMGPPGPGTAPAGAGEGGGGAGGLGVGEAAGALVGGKPRGAFGLGQAAAWVHSSGDPGRLGGGGGGGPMSPFAGAQSQMDGPAPAPPYTPHAVHAMSVRGSVRRSSRGFLRAAALLLPEPAPSHDVFAVRVCVLRRPSASARAAW